MEHNSKELKSDSYSVKDIQSKKRNYSLTTNSIKNPQLSSNSKISKDNLNNNRQLTGISSKRNNNKSLKEENHEINVISSMAKYQENIIKNNYESLQKRYQKEIADIIKFELDKQLLNFRLNKEKEIYDKEYNNINYKSLNSNNNVILSIINREKEKEKENDESKEKNKIKSKEENQEIEERALSPKPLKIINEKNFHENYYLMEHAKKMQIYEMNQIKKQKKLEKFEKLNKIKAEQIALKKRLETERATKNLQRNNYDLFMRKNNIENKMQKKDLNIYQNKQRKNEEREKEIEKNKKIEKEKLDHIKKLRLNEEKNRILLYLDLIKKEKSIEKKKLENFETKQKIITQYKELNNTRNNNLKKLKKLIRNGIDEGNIEKFYSQFPENKEIEIVFENYRKEKKEIENNSFRNKDKKLLNPLKKNSYDIISNNSDKMFKTSYEFRNKTIKIPKINIDSQNNNKNDYKDNNNNEYNDKDNQNKDINNKIVNICSTKNNKSDDENKKNENKENQNEKEKEINDNTKNQNEKNIKDIEINKNKESMKEKEKEKENEKSNQPEDIFKDNKKVLFETEIREKIKEYKKERYQPFIQMLEREKNIEENRNLKLQNINDEFERQKLENQFGKERTLVSLRLKKENEKILLDIQNYENKLREENEKNQKYNMDRINI